MDDNLKTIIDWDIKNNLTTPDGWALEIPDDYKDLLYQQLPDVTRYLNSVGYQVTTNLPDENAWHGWDMPVSRADEFPAEYLTGKNRQLYQLFHTSGANLKVLMHKVQ